MCVCVCVCVCVHERDGGGWGGHNMVMVTSAGITHSASPVKTKATWSEWGRQRRTLQQLEEAADAHFHFPSRDFILAIQICLFFSFFFSNRNASWWTYCIQRGRHTQASSAYCDNDLMTWIGGEILHSSAARIACHYPFVKQKDQKL